MTKLSGGASYCEINLNGTPRRVVVLAGHPMEFKTFCQVATGYMAGGISAYQASIDRSLVDFWEELGRPGSAKAETFSVAESATDMFGFHEHGFVSKPNYYQMLDLLIKSQDIVDGKKADFLPMLAEISRQASTVR